MSEFRKSRWAGVAGLGLTALLLMAVPTLAGGRDGDDRKSSKQIQAEVERLRERLRELEGQLRKAKGDDGQRGDNQRGGDKKVEKKVEKKIERPGAKAGERPAAGAGDGRAAALREMRDWIDRKLAEIEGKGGRPKGKDDEKRPDRGGFGGGPFGGMGGGFGKGGFGGRGGFGKGFEKKEEKREEPKARESSVEQRLDRLMRELEEIRRELRRK